MTVLPSARLPALDALRTLALALMLLYHLVFDLHVFFAMGPDPLAPGWRLLAITAATLFLLCSGASVKLALGAKPAYARWPWLRQRLVRVGSAAFLVTFASAIVLPDSFVQFGILHCITIGSLVVFGTHTWPDRHTFMLGIVCMLLPLMFPAPIVHGSFAWLVLGWPSVTFQSVDYFPLLPWAGLMLAGGAVLPRFFSRLPWSDSQAMRIITWPGRHSLLLYLAHQPILLLILYGILG